MRSVLPRWLFSIWLVGSVLACSEATTEISPQQIWTISPVVLPDRIAGLPAQLELTTDATGPVTWQLDGAPDWLDLEALENNQAVLSGRPPSEALVDFEVRVRSPSGAGRRSYRLRILKSDLGIVADGFGLAPVGRAYLWTATATGGRGPYRWRSEGLDTDFALLDADRRTVRLQGEPASPGRTLVPRLQVEDADGQTATLSGRLEVVEPPPLRISPVTLPAVDVGTFGEVRMTVDGGDGTVETRVSGLPAGMVARPLRNDGRRFSLLGRPQAPGIYVLNIQATDDVGTSTSVVRRLEVIALLDLVETASITPRACAAFELGVRARGGQPPYAITVAELPTGLAINHLAGSATATLSGSVPGGDYSIDVLIADARGQTARRTIHLWVGPGLSADRWTMHERLDEGTLTSQGVYLVDVCGPMPGSPAALIPDGLLPVGVSRSPQRTRAAGLAVDSRTSTRWLFHSDLTQPSPRIVRVPTDMTSFVWSLKGDWVAYIQPDQPNLPGGELVGLDLASSSTTPIVLSAPTGVGYNWRAAFTISFSPDGARILHVENEGSFNASTQRIYLSEVGRAASSRVVYEATGETPPLVLGFQWLRGSSGGWDRALAFTDPSNAVFEMDFADPRQPAVRPVLDHAQTSFADLSPAVDAAGRYLLAYTTTGELRTIDLPGSLPATGTPLFTFLTTNLFRAFPVFLPGRPAFAVFHPDDGLRYVDLTGVAPTVETITVPGQRSVRGFQVHPDGRHLAVAADDIVLWDTAQGRVVRTLIPNSEVGQFGTFSPDGRWYFSGGARPAFFDVSGARMPVALPLPPGATNRTVEDWRLRAFKPDGRSAFVSWGRAASSVMGKVYRFDFADAALLVEVAPLVPNTVNDFNFFFAGP